MAKILDDLLDTFNEDPETVDEFETYEYEDDELDDLQRSTASYRGYAYAPQTDHSDLYDGGYESNWGYEG